MELTDPIKSLPWYDEKKRYFMAETIKIIEKMSENKKRKAFVIGSSDRCNVGDQAIGIAEQQIFRDRLSQLNVLEITGDHYRFERDRLIDIIDKNDIIFIHGGGNLGTLWLNEEVMNRDIIQSFPNNLIIVLPQTLFLDDSKEAEITKQVYASHKRLYFFFREKNSYELASTFLDKSHLFISPDSVLYMTSMFQSFKNNKALVCFRKDHEAVLSKEEKADITWTLVNNKMTVSKTSMLDHTFEYGDIKLSERQEAVRKKLEELASAEVIVTDRLHCMILGAMVGAKVIAYDNCSHKVSGVYEWLKDRKNVRILTNKDDFEQALKDIRTQSVTIRPLVLECDNFVAKIREIIRKEYKECLTSQ